MKTVSTKRITRYNKKETKAVHVVSVLTQDQINAIDRISNQRDNGIAYILLDTGMRISELTNVNYSQVFEDCRHCKPKETITIIGKGNKERIIPLTQRAQNAFISIHRYNKRTLKAKTNSFSPICISRHHRRLNNNTIRTALKTAIGASPHTFRHTCLTNLRNHDTRLEIVQAIAGHASIVTTQKYYLSVTTDDLIKAVRSGEQSAGLHIVKAKEA